MNTSLTQKDTMDRGAWMKIQKERHAGGLVRKGQKSRKHKRWKMAWEWGTKEYFCLPYVTIVWRPSWKLPEERGNKWNSSSRPQKTYLDLEICLSLSPKLDYHQWLKVNIFSIWEIQTFGRIQHVHLLLNSLLLKK